MKKSPLRGLGMTSERTRERMVQRLQQQGVTDPRVLSVLLALPRHLFVDEALASRAYDDDALPIGFGQTISQPLTVARMTQALLRDGPLGKVLEIGTGCGYQAAVLAALAVQVYSVERVAALIRIARGHFMKLGIRNVRLRHGDGNFGWADYAPYDGIMVTAGAPDVPSALLEQLALGGRLIMPVGAKGQQRLLLVRRSSSGYDTEMLDTANFVPLQMGHQ